MKKNTFKKAAFYGAASVLLLGLTSCGPTGPEQADTYFENARFYYDISVKTPYNVSVEIGTTAPVTELTSSRNSAEAGQFVNRDGILTISGEFLSSLSAGEKTITATTGEGRITIDAFLVHKIIRTAEDFQNINDRLDGYYILGNDIDLSDIDNFEPLGRLYSETDVRNKYFHGILDGNGYTVRNATVHYSDTVATNYGNYSNTGSTHFEEECHFAGDNIGLFQVIGSAGEVRNIGFDNIDVMGRTIVGAVAGNVQGRVHDVYIGDCDVAMSTHFYDDDCNMGGAFGIVAGSGSVSNVISEIDHLQLGAPSTTSVNYNGENVEIVNGVYLDFDDVYAGETTGNGWDHPTGEGASVPWWRFAASDKVDTAGTPVIDSNGHATNGQYAFVGKCWGSVSNCVSRSFNITPMDGATRAVDFGQTHVGSNKPTSGETDMGIIEDCVLATSSEMKEASTYSAFSSDIWEIEDGKVPTLKKIYNSVESVVE